MRTIYLKKGLGSHLGNETTASVPTLIPIESSNLCENTRACLDPQIKIMARLILLLIKIKIMARLIETRVIVHNEPILL